MPFCVCRASSGAASMHCTCGVAGGAGSIQFLRVRRPRGISFDVFVAHADPPEEQLRYIFCVCGASGGAAFWSILGSTFYAFFAYVQHRVYYLLHTLHVCEGFGVASSMHCLRSRGIWGSIFDSFLCVCGGFGVVVFFCIFCMCRTSGEQPQGISCVAPPGEQPRYIFP